MPKRRVRTAAQITAQRKASAESARARKVRQRRATGNFLRQLTIGVPLTKSTNNLIRSLEK